METRHSDRMMASDCSTKAVFNPSSFRSLDAAMLLLEERGAIRAKRMAETSKEERNAQTTTSVAQLMGRVSKPNQGTQVPQTATIQWKQKTT